MLTRILSWLLLGLTIVSPVAARDPSDPNAAVPPARYSPLLSGSQSFRPVEPLPWGNVNRRVMPEIQESTPEDPKAQQQQRGPHGQH